MLHPKLLKNRKCFLRHPGIFLLAWCVSPHDASVQPVLAIRVINRLHFISLVIFGRWLKTGYWRNYELHMHMSVCVRPWMCIEKDTLLKESILGLVLFLGSWSRVVGIFLRTVRRLILWVVWHTEFWIEDLSYKALIPHNASRQHSPSTPNYFLVVRTHNLFWFGTSINFRRRWRRNVWNWEPKYVDFPLEGDWSEEHFLPSVHTEDSLEKERLSDLMASAVALWNFCPDCFCLTNCI